MKKLLMLFITLILTSSLNAQFTNLHQNEGLISGGMGLTWIDGQPFYSVRFMPEIAFSNIGIGLDLNLEFSSEGKLREENFNEFSDYASVVRYVRYGHKNDPVYARIGALDYATLGHGSILYLYNNSPTYDARKIGMEFDVDFNQFGFETVYGSFAQAGVAGIRGYIRPLKLTELGSIPILGSLEVGATFVGDFNANAGVSAGKIDSQTDKFVSTVDDGAVTAFGFDLGLPIVRAKIVNLDLYFDYANLVSYGSGTAAGVILRLNGLGLIDVATKLERRFNGDNYLPSYFNAMYEIERFKYDKTEGLVQSKVQILKEIGKVGNGYYGELFIKLLNTFDVIGSYQRLDDFPNSGIMHLATDVSPEGTPFVARAGYDKINIKNEKDLFTLDDRSYLFAELGYKPMPYIIVSMVYNWTFTPLRDGDDNIIKYIPQKKIEPRISFVYPFDFG